MFSILTNDFIHFHLDKTTFVPVESGTDKDLEERGVET